LLPLYVLFRKSSNHTICQVCKLLVQSDFKHNRVQDLERLNSKQRGAVKKYARTFLDKAVVKYEANEKQKKLKASLKNGKTTTTPPGSPPAGTFDKYGNVLEKLDVSMADVDLDIDRKRKHEDDEDNELSPFGASGESPKKLKADSESPPPAPPPPPPPEDSPATGLDTPSFGDSPADAMVGVNGGSV
jgi:hypothetical protein